MNFVSNNVASNVANFLPTDSRVSACDSASGAFTLQPAQAPWLQKGFVLDDAVTDGASGRSRIEPGRVPTLYLATLHHILSSGTPTDISLALELAPPTGGVDRPAFRRLVFMAIGQRSEPDRQECMFAATDTLQVRPTRLLDEAIALGDADYALTAVRTHPEGVSPRQFELLRRSMPHVALLALEMNDGLYRHLDFSDLDLLIERLARSIDKNAPWPNPAMGTLCDDIHRIMPFCLEDLATKAKLPAVYRAVLEKLSVPSDIFWEEIIRDAPELVSQWFALHPAAVSGTALSEIVEANSDAANAVLRAALDANPAAVNLRDHVNTCPIDQAVIMRNRVAFDILRERGGDVEGINGRISATYAVYGNFGLEMSQRLALWLAE